MANVLPPRDRGSPGGVHVNAAVKRAYNLAEACDYLGGKSEGMLRGLVRNNKIPARRDGKYLIFLREDLDAYLESLPEA